MEKDLIEKNVNTFEEKNKVLSRSLDDAKKAIKELQQENRELKGDKEQLSKNVSKFTPSFNAHIL